MYIYIYIHNIALMGQGGEREGPLEPFPDVNAKRWSHPHALNTPQQTLGQNLAVEASIDSAGGCPRRVEARIRTQQA